MNDLCVAVPARYHSTRLDKKLMHVINQKTILHHTLSKISNVINKNLIYVFCDHEILFNEATKYGYNAIMVSENCINGTERICKGIKYLNDFNNVFIIHADQPLLEEENIKSLIDFWNESSKDKNTMYTLHTKCEEYNNESIAKIALNSKTGKWLYISRKDIPSNYNVYSPMYKHFGLCIFSKELLEIYGSLEDGALQLSEDNEWLKLLENNYNIVSKEIEYHNTDLNTSKDLLYIDTILKKNIIYK